MRLHAEVEVVNRLLAGHNMKGKGKKAKSHLAIGKKPLADEEDEVFLMITSNANKQGVKYLIKNNVGNIFTKMIGEGKTTLRFNDPPHDICIKGEDVLQLKSFLMGLKKVMDGKNLEKLTLSALQPVSTKQIEGPKKKMVIQKRSEYPSTTGFPATLQSLSVIGLRLARVDARVMKLPNLVSLDLSNNEITSLPDTMGDMKCLKEFNISGNLLANLPRSFCCGSLTKSLRLLNLSDNKIQLLPNYFCSLKSLLTLNVSRNQLKALPPSINKLSNMKHFDSSGNNLRVLPGSFSSLRLDSLELSSNDFEEYEGSEARILRNRLENVSSLLELAARDLVRRGVTVDPEEVFPRLLAYLESGMRCLCSKPVWNNVVTALVKMDLGRVATQVSAGGLSTVSIETSLCSMHCLEKFKNNPYAY